jgi:hypothetical protein
MRSQTPETTPNTGRFRVESGCLEPECPPLSWFSSFARGLRCCQNYLCSTLFGSMMSIRGIANGHPRGKLVRTSSNTGSSGGVPNDDGSGKQAGKGGSCRSADHTGTCGSS